MNLPRFLMHPPKPLFTCHQLLLPRSRRWYWLALPLALLLLGGEGITPLAYRSAQAAAGPVATARFTVPQLTSVDAAIAARTAPSIQLACDFVAATEAALDRAIRCANTAGAGVHTIQITADITLTQPLTVLNNLQASQVVIEGNDHTVNAQGQGRIFSITTTQVTIRNLTLRGGRSLIDDWFAAGGAIQLRGGRGDGGCGLTITGSTLEDNQAFAGGAIANLCDDSVITITNSLLQHNQATRGGAIFIPTGEELFSELIIDQSQLTDNQAAERGGAILLNAGDAGSNATISNSTIANNRVISGTGGGLSVVTNDEAAITNALLRNVAIISNTATSGGGLEVFSHGSTNVTVANTTISSNHADGSTGGAILLQGALEFDSTDVRLMNSTVANNTAATVGGIAKLDGLITLTNTLVAGNTNGNCQWNASAGLPNRVGSGGHNLDSEKSCLTDAIRQPSDIQNGTANLGPLADNGGPTLTHLLLAGSQAIDAGNDAVCTTPPVNAVDQRGILRPQGAGCDIGAYELVTIVACTYPDLVANDEATLRQAIECLNTAPAGAYTLAVTADIVYSQPLPTLSNLAITNLAFMGNGHTLNAQAHGRVLTLDTIQKLTLRDLTLTGGLPDVNALERNGGGLYLTCSNEVSDQSECIWTLQHIVVTGNQANDGGGIAYYCGYHGGGALVVEDSVIRDNQAENVGGGLIYSSDEESGPCSLALRKTVVEGNQAVDGGGLRILRPRVTISDSIIRNNTATTVGGGLMARISDGFIDMTVLRTTISGNQAGEGGGGVYIASPDQTFTIQFINSTISGNTVTTGAGGGFYLRESNDSLRIALINSTVTANAAGQSAGVHIFHQESSFEMTGTLRLTNSLIADNLGSDCGGETAGNVPFSGQRVTSFGHNLDSDGTCLSAEVRQPSDLPNGNAKLGPLADNGGPTPTHALLAGSQALDAGDDTVCANEPVAEVDQRGITRPQGTQCDIGAYEAAAQPVAANLLFVSSHSSGQAGDVSFRDEDILAYDFNTQEWQMIFDGSDVGITKDVDAFFFRPDGTLLLSFNGPTVIPALGAVDDSDIVIFTPTRLGNETAGSFTFFLRGADVGLTTDGEDIDAIGFTADGHLIVSTIGDFNTPTLAGKDEDLIQLDGASSGTWSLFLDGSAVGLANEDINGFWLDTTMSERYLTVKDSFAFTEGQNVVQIDADDIFVCTPAQTGSCTYRRFWDSDLHGYGAENLDGIGLGVLPATVVAGGQTDSTGGPEGMAADEDIDDLNLEELINQQFVPLVAK